jgi:hypothetical protein
LKEWILAQVGDVNGNGKADIVWMNQANGLIAVWFKDGLTISSVGFSDKPSTDWENKN